MHSKTGTSHGTQRKERTKKKGKERTEKRMTKVVEQIAETVVYDDEYDVEEGNGRTSTNNNHNASEEEEEENASEEEKEQQQIIIEIETKYERYRDDQMNTGIIAALVGGFALTNSWEMNIYENDKDLVSNIELSSYTLAILAVHGCTCSALVSAFLYRSITRVKSPQAGVQWVERHPILVQLPWFKFLFGTASYIISVILVAWTTLQFNTVSRIITLLGGICGCSIVVYTCYIIYTDAACIECEDEDHYVGNEGNDRKQQSRRAVGSSSSASGSSTSLRKIPNSMKSKNKQNKNVFSSNIYQIK